MVELPFLLFSSLLSLSLCLSLSLSQGRGWGPVSLLSVSLSCWYVAGGLGVNQLRLRTESQTNINKAARGVDGVATGPERGRRRRREGGRAAGEAGGKGEKSGDHRTQRGPQARLCSYNALALLPLALSRRPPAASRRRPPFRRPPPPFSFPFAPLPLTDSQTTNPRPLRTPPSTLR